MNDVEHMRRALAQAATVRSTTAPNPWVGSVVVPPDSVSDGRTVFAGATAPPGGPHAEVTALAAAGEAARGATLYVTLEPCAHHGRTPPCSDAIIAAGVTRVVVGMEDPDEKVAGRGIAALRAAGIDVDGRGGRRRGRRAARPLLQAPDDRAALGRAQDGGQPRRAHRRSGRHQPLDHGRGGPPRRAPPAGPVGRRPGRCGHGPGGRPRADGPPRRRRRRRRGAGTTAPRGAGAGPAGRQGAARPWSWAAIWRTC